MLGAIWDAIVAIPKAIWGRVLEEPVMTQAVLQAGLALLVTFGLGWTLEQVGATLALTAALLGWLTRSKVTPVA